MLTRTDVASGAADSATYSPDGLTSASKNANATTSISVDVMGGHATTMALENGVEYTNGQTLNQPFNAPDTSTVTSLTFGGTPSRRITDRDPLLGALESVSLGGHTVTFGYNHQLGVRKSTTYVPPTRLTDGSLRSDSYAPFTALPVETSFSVAQVDSVLHRAYGYDSAGRLTTEQVAINYFNDGDGARRRQRQFSYDSLGRLTSVTVRRGTCMPWPSDVVAPDSLSLSFGWRYTCGTVASDSGATYSYDAVGNRTDHGAAFDPGDRLASFNGDTITYDDDGNMTRRYNPVTGADHRYVWNAFGQLDSAVVVSAINPVTGQRATVIEHYLYDASGRLVHINASPDPGWFVYQGDQVSEVVQSQSAYTDVAYDDGTDRPALEYIHTLPSDEWRAQVVDPMGNLAGTVNLDSIGVPHTWDAWGKNTSTTWDAMDALGWKGLLPETGAGLIHMRARWYDPELGRFLSEDPAGLSAGINPYVFAGDDPINASDPSGALVTDAQGDVCSLYATSCGDPLEFPGGSSYTSSAYGGGVSFAGGFGSITPGVSVGSAVIGLDGDPLLCASGECARHSVIATLTSNGNLDIYQLYNQIVGLTAVLRSYVDDGSYLNDPSTGFGITFTDWRWMNVAGVDAIARVSNAVSLLTPYWTGRPYQLGDSNIFVNQVLSSAGITLSSQQQKRLGWRPTFGPLPRDP